MHHAAAIDRRLDALARQRFRARFHLRGRDAATVSCAATATCCRSCLERWHAVPKGSELTPAERAYVVDVIWRWIERELAETPIPA